jgi:exonuclease III
MNGSTKKIASLNLCLGLKNKKESVKRLIIENDIDIMCMQETEVPVDFPTDLLMFKGYCYENESNQFKSR